MGPSRVNVQTDQQQGREVTGRFFKDGIGNQFGFHVCDDSPLFAVSLPMLFREASFGAGRGMFTDPDNLFVAFLLGSLNAPVYVSVPVRDQQVTDEFLDLLERRLGLYARQPRLAGWFRIEPDFYRIEEPGRPVVRCQSIKLGPLKWRMFWTRIDNAIYVASQRSILDDLFEAHQNAEEHRPQSPHGHAMVRMRAEHWRRILPEFQLGWAENNRTASLNNISPIYGAARALLSESAPAERSTAGLDLSQISDAAHAEADAMYGVHFFCPDGGDYVLADDGLSMVSTLHGTPLLARQGAAPPEGVATTRLLSDFREVTATLTFEDDGLRAVLEIERKQ
ncbi:MAG: hypothetical protein R3B90_00485 [Planctomycetaceae bacterium]